MKSFSCNNRNFWIFYYERFLRIFFNWTENAQLFFICYSNYSSFLKYWSIISSIIEMITKVVKILKIDAARLNTVFLQST